MQVTSEGTSPSSEQLMTTTRAINVPTEPPEPRLPEDWPQPPPLPEEPPPDPIKTPELDPPQPEPVIVPPLPENEPPIGLS